METWFVYLCRQGKGAVSSIKAIAIQGDWRSVNVNDEGILEGLLTGLRLPNLDHRSAMRMSAMAK